MVDRKPISFLRTLTTGLELPTGDLREPMVLHLYNNLGTIMVPLAFATGFNALAVSYVFSSYVRLEIVLIWLAPLLFFSGLQYRTGKAMTTRKLDRAPSGKFIKRAERNTFIFGAWWAASCWLLDTHSDLLNLALAAASMGMCAAAAACVGPMAGMAARFMQGALPITLAALFMSGNAAVLLVLFLGSALAAILVYMSHLKYVDTLAMIEAQFEANLSFSRLKGAIESATSGIRIVDQRGRLILENRMSTELRPSDQSKAKVGEDGFIRSNGKYLRERKSTTTVGDEVTVIENLTDIIKHQKELERTRKEAIDSGEAKTRFLGTMSHELISPVNTIMGMSSLMMRESMIEFTQEDIENYAESIHDSAKDLLGLIRNVIDYSRLEQQEVLNESSFVDLHQMLRNAMSGAVKLASRNDRIDDFRITISRQARHLMVDEMSLQRVLTNLITNAMVFSKQGTPILIKASLDLEGAPTIIIRDHGLGMSEKDIPRAMEPFTQLAGDQSRRWNGPGLGLSISKRLVESMNGHLSISSALGKWTNVTIQLPTATRISQDLGPDDRDDVRSPVRYSR